MSAEGNSSEKSPNHFSRGRNVEVSNRRYAVHGKNTKFSARALYYNPANPTAFSTLKKLSAAFPKKNKSDVRPWPEQQESYSKHRPVTKRFLRNQYTLSKLMDVREYDLLHVQSLAKYNHIHRYILSVIDVFRNICFWCPYRQRAARPSPERSGPYFTTTTCDAL